MTGPASPVSTQGDAIYWRGIWCPPSQAVRLAEGFEAVTDWFRPTAQRYAADLRAALAQVKAEHPQEKTLQQA